MLDMLQVCVAGCLKVSAGMLALHFHVQLCTWSFGPSLRHPGGVPVTTPLPLGLKNTFPHAPELYDTPNEVGMLRVG